MSHDCSWLITSLHCIACISYRYDDGSTDQLKDDWEFKDGVMVFSSGDDAMGFYSVDGGWSKDADTNFLIYLTQTSSGA